MTPIKGWMVKPQDGSGRTSKDKAVDWYGHL